MVSITMVTAMVAVAAKARATQPLAPGTVIFVSCLDATTYSATDAWKALSEEFYTLVLEQMLRFLRGKPLNSQDQQVPCAFFCKASKNDGAGRWSIGRTRGKGRRRKKRNADQVWRAWQPRCELPKLREWKTFLEYKDDTNAHASLRRSHSC